MDVRTLPSTLPRDGDAGGLLGGMDGLTAGSGADGWGGERTFPRRALVDIYSVSSG